MVFVTRTAFAWSFLMDSFVISMNSYISMENSSISN